MADKMDEIDGVPHQLARDNSDAKSDEKKDLYPRDDAVVTGGEIDIVPVGEEVVVKKCALISCSSSHADRP